MNIGALWDQLVSAVCRPPRDMYDDSDLVGGRRAAFAFGETRSRIKKYYRQDVQLVNPLGQRIQCSHFRPCVVTSKDGRLPCCIYCHTNSGSRRDAEEILFHLLPKGITVFSLDFAGSGNSEGDWVTLGAHEVNDLATAVDYLREEGSTSTLALWGRSMGAVTALMYSHRDPSIAGVVVDSPFSRLTDLMLELATDSQQGLSVPRPLVKVALTMMRRSVRRRAGFSIDEVSPLDTVSQTFVPTLFGHSAGDTFVAPHHSERLFVAHGADTKNFISFEGDHNGMRPDFWYDSAMIFLLSVLRVEELVGPDIDLNEMGLAELPHMSGRGIYVAGGSTTTEGGSTGSDEEEVLQNTGRSTRVSLSAPWDISNTRIGSGTGLDRSRSEVASLERPPGALSGRGKSGVDDYLREQAEVVAEEEMLQRVIEMSLAEANAGTGGAGVEQGAAADAPAVGGNADDYDEEAALAAAVAESLKTSGEFEEQPPTAEGGEGGEMPAVLACNRTLTIEEESEVARHRERSQSPVLDHAAKEAAAAHAAADQAQHALADVVHDLEESKKTSTAVFSLPDEEDAGEQWLEELRNQTAKYTGTT